MNRVIRRGALKQRKEELARDYNELFEEWQELSDENIELKKEVANLTEVKDYYREQVKECNKFMSSYLYKVWKFMN
jgi:cell division protein FtsB